MQDQEDIRHMMAADVARIMATPERCPQCGALVPAPQTLDGVGTIARAVQHRAWCPLLRQGYIRFGDPASSAEIQRATVDLAAADVTSCPECGQAYSLFTNHDHRDTPPAPGPIWTNGQADDDDRPALGYTDEQLRHARGALAYAVQHMGRTWPLWALGYITGNTHREPMTETQRAMAAALAELAEWPTTTERN